MDWARIASALGAASAVFIACLAAALTFMNTEIQKSRKRHDLYRLLKAEITNLERHCRLSSDDVEARGVIDVAKLRMARFREGNMLLFDAKEAYLLNENICQDVMTLFLLSRNNDIFIDELVIILRSDKYENEKIQQRIVMLRNRLSQTAQLAAKVMNNLEHFAKHPKSYNRPTINW